MANKVIHTPKPTYGLLRNRVPYLFALIFMALFQQTTLGQNTVTVDWSTLRIEQFGCGLPSSTGASGAYDDIDLDLLSDMGMSIEYGPDSLHTCASGKIRYQNGGQQYVYTSSLTANNTADCSWTLIRFDQAVKHISFELLDVDKAIINNWQDQITITPGWSTIYPNSNLNINNEDHMITGIANCDSHEQDCNTLVEFEGPLTEIRLEYCYGADIQTNHPDRQLYNIGNISFEEYTLQPSIEVHIECPKEESFVSFKDIQLLNDEKLEIIQTNAIGEVTSRKSITTPKIYNEDITFINKACGSVDTYILKSNITAPDIQLDARMIDQMEHHTILHQQNNTIEDEEGPSFDDDIIDEHELYCDELPPPIEIRLATDNCTTSDLIDQKVDEISYYNEGDECADYRIVRYWTITDLCGNETIDSTTYYFHEREIVDPEIPTLNNEALKIEASNIFSPNGDGVNDYFTYHINRAEHRATIYLFDRNGSMIFQKTQSSNSELVTTELGGDFQQLRLSSGVYVWLIEIENALGSKEILSGEVTIIL